eukprot:gene31868-39369_t
MFGFGVKLYANGDRYVGQWTNNQRSGEGEFTTRLGDVYTGTWCADSMLTGVLKYRNGDRYTGDFRGNARNGVGIMQYKNGDEYSGNVKVYDGVGRINVDGANQTASTPPTSPANYQSRPPQPPRPPPSPPQRVTPQSRPVTPPHANKTASSPASPGSSMGTSSPVLYQVLNCVTAAVSPSKKPRIAPEAAQQSAPATPPVVSTKESKQRSSTKPMPSQLSVNKSTAPLLTTKPTEDSNPLYLKPSLLNIVPLQSLKDMIAHGSSTHVNVEEAKRYAEQVMLTGLTPTGPVVTHSKWRTSIAAAAEKQKNSTDINKTPMTFSQAIESSASQGQSKKPLLTVNVLPPSPSTPTVHIVSPKSALTKSAVAAIRRSECQSAINSKTDSIDFPYWREDDDEEEEVDVPIQTANRSAMLRVNKAVLSAANLRHKRQTGVRTSVSAEDHIQSKKVEQASKVSTANNSKAITTATVTTSVNVTSRRKSVTWLDVERGAPLTSSQSHCPYVSDEEETRGTGSSGEENDNTTDGAKMQYEVEDEEEGSDTSSQSSTVSEDLSTVYGGASTGVATKSQQESEEWEQYAYLYA